MGCNHAMRNVSPVDLEKPTHAVFLRTVPRKCCVPDRGCRGVQQRRSQVRSDLEAVTGGVFPERRGASQMRALTPQLERVGCHVVDERGLGIAVVLTHTTVCSDGLTKETRGLTLPRNENCP